MTDATSKIWIRLMAVLQLMTALSFIQLGIYAYQNLSSDQTVLSSAPIAICVVLSVLNLVAGWTLLDESRFALWLSLGNILIQTVSINLPIFAYIYAGVARFSVWISVHSDQPDIHTGVTFDILQSGFRVALS